LREIYLFLDCFPPPWSYCLQQVDLKYMPPRSHRTIGGREAYMETPFSSTRRSRWKHLAFGMMRLRLVVDGVMLDENENASERTGRCE